MLPSLSISASGMRASSLRMEAVASNVANPTATTSREVVQTPLPGGGVDAQIRPSAQAPDLISDVTNMVLARTEMSASVQVANVTYDMIKKLFEL